MFISATFCIVSFCTLPFIPQKKSASNFPQITPWQLSAFRKIPLPIARPSVVCRLSVGLSPVTFVHPTQAVAFFHYFCGIWYLGHPLTPTENFMEIIPGEPLRRGSYAAFQNAQKSEFPSSFFRVLSVPVKSEVGTRKFIEIQVNK